MSDDSENDRRCEALRGGLSDLALGLLTGRERAEVLAHVGSCPWCWAELERLSFLADAVLELAPEAEPPVGFEVRLVERLRGTAAKRPPRPLQRVRALAFVATAAILVGVGVGEFASGRGEVMRPLSGTAKSTSAILTSHGQSVGEVMVSAGSPTWLFVTVDDDPWSGTVKCTVTLADGGSETTGFFRLSGGYGAWGAPLSGSAGQVRAAQLTAADGTVIASARIHP